MFCNWCGKEVDSNSKFCPYCGREITNPTVVNNNAPGVDNSSNFNATVVNNSNVNQNALNSNVVNPTGMVLGAYNATSTNVGQGTEEKTNILLVIVSFLIPVVGLVIFLTYKDKQPKTSKACGISALVCFILNIVLVFVIAFLSVFVYNTIDDNHVDEPPIIDSPSNSYEETDEDENTDDTDTNDSTIDENLSTEWGNYEFVVNGKTLSLPGSYNDLKDATGFSMKSADEKSYLENNYYVSLNLYKNDNLALYIEVLNDSGSDLQYSEAKLTRISQTEYQVSNGADKIVFPGGLTVGIEITEDRIKELFGEPTDTYEYSSDNYESVTYTYNADTTWTTTNYYEIRVVNGVIDELTLDHRDS